MTTQGQEEKRYDPGDTTLKFVNRPDDLDPLRKSPFGLMIITFTTFPPQWMWSDAKFIVCSLSPQPQMKETSVSVQRCPAVMLSPRSLSLGGVAACWIRYFKASHSHTIKICLPFIEIVRNPKTGLFLSKFQGQYKFKCPALKKDTLQKCEEVWSYQEVRRLAVLTAEEMQYFEESMARLAAAEYCDFKSVSDISRGKQLNKK